MNWKTVAFLELLIHSKRNLHRKRNISLHLCRYRLFPWKADLRKATFCMFGITSTFVDQNAWCLCNIKNVPLTSLALINPNRKQSFTVATFESYGAN